MESSAVFCSPLSRTMQPSVSTRQSIGQRDAEGALVARPIVKSKRVVAQIDFFSAVRETCRYNALDYFFS